MCAGSVFARTHNLKIVGSVGMIRDPEDIIFVCQQCERESSVEEMFQKHDRCKDCVAAEWTICLIYVDRETTSNEVSNGIGLLSLAVLGGGWSHDRETKDAVHHLLVRNVKAEILRPLFASLSSARTMVLEYIRLRQKQDMRSQGGDCLACGALYVSAAAKPWTSAGFCSKSCAATKNWKPPEEVAFTAATASMIAVECSQGHTFEVLPSFAGCVRPCPECGQKSRVP